MAKNKIAIHLMCEDCRERNYTHVVSKKRVAGSLQLKKYCSRCRSHRQHKETK